MSDREFLILLSVQSVTPTASFWVCNRRHFCHGLVLNQQQVLLQSVMHGLVLRVKQVSLQSATLPRPLSMVGVVAFVLGRSTHL